MKRFVVAVLAIVVVAAIAVAAGFKNLTSREAKAFLEKNRATFLLDVRTPEEYRQARLKGAVLIPVSELERRLASVPKNRPVVVYCAVGTRSSVAAGYLVTRGYTQVYNVSDGIVGWYRNGLPIER